MIPTVRAKVLRWVRQGYHPTVIMRRFGLTDRELLDVIAGYHVTSHNAPHAAGWHYWAIRLKDSMGVATEEMST